ncbi:MAG: M23 family metallopeptidase [Ardenticatenaceae bacterium]|nr:M23 family metallopeptidase [Ardenticatenaceae bacterium]
MSGFKFDVWPTDHRTITQHFGANPQNYAQFGLPGHEGVDIRAPSGSNIYCVAPGTVVTVHKKAADHNYGIHVKVDHMDGYQTTYAHLQETRVSEGEQVTAGTLLGLADNTGNSFGSHLHLTLKKAGTTYNNWPRNIMDPTPFLLPLMGWQVPNGPYIGGWVLTVALVIQGSLAQALPDGVTLRIGPQENALVPGGTLMIVMGQPQGDYTPVQVPATAVTTTQPDLPTQPDPEPPPSIATLEGWAWASFLNPHGQQAIVNSPHGINIRTQPDSSSTNLGMVRTGSTVTLLGQPQTGYLPVRVRRVDFLGPVILPPPPPLPNNLTELPDGVILGWVAAAYLQMDGSIQALTGYRNTQMSSQPQAGGQFVGTVRGTTAVTLAGLSQANTVPILVNDNDCLRLAEPLPVVTLPQPFTDAPPPPTTPLPPQQTKLGWVLTSEITIDGHTAVAGPYGLHLRQSPHRQAEIIGFIPAQAAMIVPSMPVGEFTPVRVDETIVQPPMDETLPDQPDPGTWGQARIGLHASADPPISEAEHTEFAALRPGLIKVLSFHDPQDITRLKNAHPQAAWVLRAFLSFGGRNIAPPQFLQDTESDVRRSLHALQGKQVVVELHNEPNIAAEGLYSSWANGRFFNDWWLDLLSRYRQAFPGVRFIYPGLSPGSTVSGTKLDHIQFLEASREAVEAADGLGVHLYWSNVYPMTRALDVLDDVIGRFRNKAIWITEASHNKGGATPTQKAQQYLQFWHELQKRPIVQGVTYFVASASNPAFAEETWLGKGIAEQIGRR